jgi:iron complex transport system permease protein
MILMRYRQELNILSMGEEGAFHLGVEVEKVKKVLLILCSILIALSVSYTGTIGFVGLIIPHIVRIVHGNNYKRLMPLSALYGALFLILSDTLSRGLAEGIEIPVGVITSLVGAPFFIFLLLRNKKI